MKKFLTTAAVAASVAFGGAAAANASCDDFETLDNGGWAYVVEQEDNVYWVWATDSYVTGQFGDTFEAGSEDFMKYGMALAIHNVCFGIGGQTTHLDAPSSYHAPEIIGEGTFAGYQLVVESNNTITLD